MIQQTLKFNRMCSDARFARYAEQSEMDSVFEKMSGYSEKKIWLKFEDEKQQSEWLAKMGFPVPKIREEPLC